MPIFDKAMPTTDGLKQMEEVIAKDMEARQVKFDLSGDFFIRIQCLPQGCESTFFFDRDADNTSECPTCHGSVWKTYGKKWVFAHASDFWTELKSTNDIKVPTKFRDWLVGQEMALRRSRLEMLRWVEKVRSIQDARKKGIDPSGMLKERPGPYVLYISEPGCGKSLLLKILAEEMEELYKNAGIELSDVLCIENKMDRYRPLIRYVPAGVGQRVVKQVERAELNEQKGKQQLLFTFLTVIMVIGGALVVTALFILGMLVMQFGLVGGWLSSIGLVLPILIAGMVLMVFPMMIFVLRGGAMFGVNQRELLNVPVVLVDNGPGRKLVVNATVTNLPTLLGDIKWNAYGDCGIKMYTGVGRPTLISAYAHEQTMKTAQAMAVGRRGQVQRVEKFEPQLWSGTAYRVKGKYLPAVETTDKHPFYVLQRAGQALSHDKVLLASLRVWKRAEQICSSTDYLIVPKPRLQTAGYPVLKLDYFRPQVSKAGKVLRFNTRPSPVPDEVVLDEDVARFLGWYAAEGWTTQTNPKFSHETIGLTMHQDEMPIAEELVAILAKAFRIKARVIARRRYVSGSKTIDVLCKSRKLASWLRQHIGTEATDKRIPEEVFEAPISVREAFLRGYLQGDGNPLSTQTGTLTVKTVSEALHYDTFFLALSCNMLASSGHADGGTYLLTLSPKYVARLFSLGVSGATSEQGQAFLEDSDNFYVPIESIETFPYEGIIYNLVTEDHTFTAPMLTHNTPGLTPPLHTRVVAGDLHRGNFKLVFIDEIRNLPSHIAVEMLTAMEDGETPIKAHSGGGMGNTESSSILAVATQDPVECNVLLIAAGNMDLLTSPESVLRRVPAFRDRFQYGDIIYFDTHMDATPMNEVKIAQVVTDEIYRFGLRPMTKDGLRRLVEYMRSRAANNQRFRVMWRFAIKAIIKAHELALENGSPMIGVEEMDQAINVFCRSIEQQALEEYLINRRPFSIVPSVDHPEVGVVKGLAVIGSVNNEPGAGVMGVVVANTYPVDDLKLGDFVVTGVTKAQESWVQDSIRTVRTAIRRLYGVDIAKQYYTQIQFAQTKDVEGPSAGVTMTLALMSLLGDPRLSKERRKPIPIRQDVAVTGTIELIPSADSEKSGDIRVGAIGGVAEKVQGAADAGCRFVVVPMENFEHSLTQERYPARVFGADSVLGYFDLVRDDNKLIEGLLSTGTDGGMTEEDVRIWAERAERRKGDARL